MLRRCKGSGRAVTAVRGYYQPSVAWNNCSTMPYRCMNIYSISLCWFWEHWHFDFGLSRTGLIIFLRLCNCVLPLKATELRATWFWLCLCRTSNNYFTTWKHWEWFVCLAHATNTAGYLAHKSPTVVLFFVPGRACFPGVMEPRPARWHVYVILRARDSDCEW